MDTSRPPPLPPLPPAAFSPVSEGQREPLLDVLRGFAIFGILVVNIVGFKAPFLAISATGKPWHEGFFNEVTVAAIAVLAMGKFVALFALLFGLGMMMQRQRAAATARPFGNFFARRMLVLLPLGVAHGIFLWAGDILAIYAGIGLVGLLFVNCRARVLLIWSAALFAAFLLVMGLLMSLETPEEAVIWWREMGEWWVASYSQGSFGQILLARLAEWGLTVGLSAPFYLPYVFAFFLFGMALGRMEVLSRLVSWRPRLRVLAAIGIVAGLTLNAGYPLMLWRPDLVSPSVGYTAQLAGSALLSLSYAVLFYFLVSSGRCRGLLDRLAAVGRLALSNYLLQSIIANILFMSWGLGLYGRVEAPAGLLIVAAVFGLQLWLSPVWLRFFRIGPFEWLWRTLAYGKRPPLRRRREGF